VFSLIFLALTIDTHREVVALTHADQITPEVLAGKHVWHRKNCVNCHTLLGEGAYYAPDLTKIAQQRGAPYLRSFLADPARFYSEQRDRRVMPNLHLSPTEIDDLVAFLTWVGRIDDHGWPPRPILVSGAAIPGSNVGGAPPRAASDDPVAVGQALFEQSPPGCFACHSTAAGVNLVGPSLAGIATTAAARVGATDYHGKATDAAGYIRESILDPNAYLVPGATYSSNGQSLMPPGFGQSLQPGQVDALVAYLMTLK
ncbi:MAG TPA: cytochrome c, partial [Gemmatimonadales bacterium]|nr:cytochrome c [Gemmatimonadales bacterium]